MHYLIGVFLILISGSSFGTLGIFARLAYEDRVTPITLLFLEFGIASFCMLLAMPIKGILLPRGWILLGLALMSGKRSFWQEVKRLRLNSPPPSPSPLEGEGRVGGCHSRYL